MNNRTLAIIKPDAVSKGAAGKIIDRILSSGFEILAMKMVLLTKEQAKRFYQVHRQRSFFRDLVELMSSGPCFPMVLQKENAVEAFRELIGATNPADAAKGTIRKEFAESIQNNAVHGSDSDETAGKEIAFFFSAVEIPTD